MQTLNRKSENEYPISNRLTKSQTGCWCFGLCANKFVGLLVILLIKYSFSYVYARINNGYLCVIFQQLNRLVFVVHLIVLPVYRIYSCIKCTLRNYPHVCVLVFFFLSFNLVFGKVIYFQNLWKLINAYYKFFGNKFVWCIIDEVIFMIL